jgi:hypothetical protein
VTAGVFGFETRRMVGTVRGVVGNTMGNAAGPAVVAVIECLGVAVANRLPVLSTGKPAGCSGSAKAGSERGDRVETGAGERGTGDVPLPSAAPPQ